MSSAEDPLAWVAKAEEDFDTARYALRRKKLSAYVICFHAQQCAEKYLKAMLVERQHDFPKTHDLRRLYELCNSAGVFVATDVESLDRLSSYSVRVRYPGDDPNPDEVRDAMETTKRVRRLARKFLGVK